MAVTFDLEIFKGIFRKPIIFLIIWMVENANQTLLMFDFVNLFSRKIRGFEILSISLKIKFRLFYPTDYMIMF